MWRGAGEKFRSAATRVGCVGVRGAGLRLCKAHVRDERSVLTVFLSIGEQGFTTTLAQASNTVKDPHGHEMC